jgi:hypothetical protein
MNNFIIPDNIFDKNLKFYFFLKYLVKAKLTEKQSLDVLEMTIRFTEYQKLLDMLNDYCETKIKGQAKQEIFLQILEQITNDEDAFLFAFSLRLYCIKDWLLAEAKMREIANKSELAEMHVLSLAYDAKSTFTPYSTRVNGALLALLFFKNIEEGNLDFVSANSSQIISDLCEQGKIAKQHGIEPNQIFMLMFSESINQSIISDSGSDFESRIMSVLIDIGIPIENITKVHDSEDKSTEFDFFFTLGNRKYGIGAKRTLRERYKQFIKTAQKSDADIYIQITLGRDLNEEKAKIITQNNVILFVANEVYDNREFLRNINGVYSLRDLTINKLGEL